LAQLDVFGLRTEFVSRHVRRSCCFKLALLVHDVALPLWTGAAHRTAHCRPTAGPHPASWYESSIHTSKTWYESSYNQRECCSYIRRRTLRCGLCYFVEHQVLPASVQPRGYVTSRCCCFFFYLAYVSISILLKVLQCVSWIERFKKTQKIKA